jgi:hypothetical protein
LEHKSQIRIKLAEHVKAYPEPVKLIKQAMTSIGFGARISGGSWLIDKEWQTPALDDILMNREDRERFMNDPWVKSFVAEQQKMTKDITKHFINIPGFTEKVINVPNMFNIKNNTIRQSQVMSYLFQHAEKMIIDLITQEVEVIAHIHDSFITKLPLTNNQMQHIKMTLVNLDPLMTIDHEVHSAWTSTDIDDESDVEEAWGKLTGVKYIKPKTIKKQFIKKEKHTEGFYDSPVDYGQTEYDEENDPYVATMTKQQLKEHYRIIGHTPEQVPSFIKDLL